MFFFFFNLFYLGFFFLKQTLKKIPPPAPQDVGKNKNKKQKLGMCEQVLIYVTARRNLLEVEAMLEWRDFVRVNFREPLLKEYFYLNNLLPK